MINISIIYFSSTGTTRTLAKAIAEGANAQSNVESTCIEISNSDLVQGRYINKKALSQLEQSDAIIFGSPTYMGNVSAQFKAMADATSELWSLQRLEGKIAAGFTCGSAPNGDQSNTLQYMNTLANQHGMLWVGLDSAYGNADRAINPLGCQLGLSAQSVNGKTEESYISTARYLGRRVAQKSMLLTSTLYAANKIDQLVLS